MSYAPVGPPARQRPAVVTTAVILLYVAIATIVAFAGTLAYQFSVVKQPVLDFLTSEADRLDASVDLESVKSAFNLISGLLVVIALVIGGGLLTLAILNGKGKNGARITTWVIAGLGVLCCGFSAIGNLATPSGTFTTTVDVEDTQIDEAAFQKVINDALPSWSSSVPTILTIVALLCFIGVVITLALPDAHPFFRKQVVAWTPPGYGPGGFPGQTPYPQYGQQPYPGPTGTYPPPPGGEPLPPPPGQYPPNQPPPGQQPPNQPPFQQ